jgi:hypothetical protein
VASPEAPTIQTPPPPRPTPAVAPAAPASDGFGDISLPIEDDEPIPLAAPLGRPQRSPKVELEIPEETDEVALETTGSGDAALPFLDPEPSADTPRESLAELLGEEIDPIEPEPQTEPSFGRTPPRAPAAAAAPAPAAAAPKPAPAAPASEGAEEDEFLLDALFDEIQAK